MTKNPKKIFKPNRGQAKTMMVWALLILTVMLLKFFSDANLVPEQNFNIKELMNAATSDSLTKISIKSDPTAGQDWYTVKGSIKNPVFGKPDAPKDAPRELPFVFNGKISEERYKVLTAQTAPWTVEETPAG
ncbi:MAG: hypothetical protein HP060_03370 [Opitutales bacterium]|nr:hypothetical protein [Opitutales bacterium]